MGGSAPSPDLFWARRAAAGHADAWERLVEAHGRRLFNLALQFAGSREDAEDLTQEIFLRLHISLKSYRGEVPFVGWALRLSRNLCIDHYRRARAERRWGGVADVLLEQVPAQENPEEESQERQRMALLYEALGELPQEAAEVVVLCDLQGWTLEEVGAYLDVPLGTVKSRLFRARNRLAELLRPRLSSSTGGGGSVEVARRGGAP